MKHIKRFFDENTFSKRTPVNKMTTYIILLVCCYLGIAYARTDMEIKKWFIQQTLDCSKEHQVSGEEIQMLKNHRIPNNKNAKCLIACMFKKLNWIDETGMFNDKNAYKTSEKEFSEDKARLEKSKKLYEVCLKVNEESVSDEKEGCERSALLASCLIEQSPQMGFMI